MNEALKLWCEAVTRSDFSGARTALKEAAPLLKTECMDAKELEIYNRVTQDVSTKLTVLNKTSDGLELGYAIDSAKTRNGANMVSIGKTASNVSVKVGDTVFCKIGTVRPVLKSGLYGCTASGIRVLYKTDGQPASSREIIGAASENGSLVCDPAMMEGIKKFNLKTNTGYTVSRDTRLVKVDGEKRLVYCVIYEPGDGSIDSRDTDGQWADAESVEDSAHWFFVYGNPNNIKLNHQTPLSQANTMVESYIAPCDFEINGQVIKQGSWVGVWFVGDDADWENWKNGTYIGVSLDGAGTIMPDAHGLTPQDVAA